MINFQVCDGIELKILGKEDAQLLFCLVDDNRLYLREWLPWLDSNTSISDSLKFIESTHDQYNNNCGFMCGIFYEKELVGVCGFHPIDKLNRVVTIGYWIDEKSQGRGIITSCVKFLIGYAFEKLNLNKVLIPAAEGNIRSQAVSLRLGFVNEGIDREAECLYGKFVNHVRYTMLKSEWRKC